MVRCAGWGGVSLASITTLHKIHHSFNGIWTTEAGIVQNILRIGSNATANITYSIGFRRAEWNTIIFQTIRSVGAKTTTKNEFIRNTQNIRSNFAAQEKGKVFTYFMGVCWPIGISKPTACRYKNRLCRKLRIPTGHRRVHGSAFISELSWS